MRSGTARSPSTPLIRVPRPPKQMPSPAASACGLSSAKLRRSAATTRPTYSPTDLGVSNDATPGRRPAKKYSDSPRVKLLAGSGSKSGTLVPAEARTKPARTAIAASTARR